MFIVNFVLLPQFEFFCSIAEVKVSHREMLVGHDKNHILAFYQIFSSKVFKHTFTGNEGKVWLWEKSVEFGWRLLNFTRFKPKLNFRVLSNISIHQHSVATRLRKMKQIKKRMNCRSCTMVHPQRVGNHNIF